MTKNEGDSFKLLFKMIDEDGANVAPTTIRYKIECLTNGRNIRPYQTLTPALEVEIQVESGDNVILTDSNRIERRQLQLQTNFGTATQNVITSEWDVRNLQ